MTPTEQQAFDAMEKALELCSKALTAQEWRFTHRGGCNTNDRSFDVIVRGCNCDLRDVVAAVNVAAAALTLSRSSRTHAGISEPGALR